MIRIQIPGGRNRKKCMISTFQGAHYGKKCLILEIPGGEGMCPWPPSYPGAVLKSIITTGDKNIPRRFIYLGRRSRRWRRPLQLCTVQEDKEIVEEFSNQNRQVFYLPLISTFEVERITLAFVSLFKLGVEVVLWRVLLGRSENDCLELVINWWQVLVCVLASGLRWGLVMIRGRRLMIYGVPLRDWEHKPPVPLVVPTLVILLPLSEQVSPWSDKVATLVILVVAATEGEEVVVKHLEQGGLLGEVDSKLVRLRVKVHLSWEDSHVMMSSSTLIVAWFFKMFPFRDCIPADQIKLGLWVDTTLGSTCNQLYS